MTDFVFLLGPLVVFMSPVAIVRSGVLFFKSLFYNIGQLLLVLNLFVEHRVVFFNFLLLQRERILLHQRKFLFNLKFS